jgi:prepilin-type processing-associated H-X9-DG protein/prepilin-type N-terminal cleavage/methylation domain-containing protein
MRSQKMRAFTLVELMVVIGIIALLIAILMPALAQSRQQAQATACLSNLRQIGMAFEMYSGDNHGAMVPFQLYDASQPKPTPANWTPLHDSWFTILVDGRYIAAPDETNSGRYTYGNSVLRCPTGVDQKWTTITPASEYAQTGAQFWRVTSLGTQKNYDCWYGANAANETDLFSDYGGSVPFPMNAAPFTNSPYIDRQVKFTQVRHCEDLVLLYDGVQEHFGWGDGYRVINARHNNNKTTNLLFCDGHAATYPRTQLPNTNNEMNTLAALNAAHPYPHWRLDQ